MVGRDISDSSHSSGSLVSDESVFFLALMDFDSSRNTAASSRKIRCIFNITSQEPSLEMNVPR